MQQFLPILAQTALFRGVKDDEIRAMLGCLGGTVRTYRKGETVFGRGEKLRYVAVLAEGQLLVQRDDYWGNRSIITAVEVGDMFGEAYAVCDSGPFLNDVVAQRDSTVVLFDMNRLLTVCSSACRFHAAVVQNMVSAVAHTNRRLMQKLGHISRRTTREKLISYLSDEAGKHNGATFVIPFNRQQLADYLSVDRSAMSNELCKMRDEGLLTFHKSTFTLYHQREGEGV